MNNGNIDKNMQESILTPAYWLKCFSQDGFGGIGIEAHVRHIAGLIFVIGLRADHGGIIATERKGRQIHLCPQLFRGLENVCPNPGIGRYTAGHCQLLAPRLLQRPYHPGCQRFGHCGSKCGAKAGNIQLLPHLFPEKIIL